MTGNEGGGENVSSQFAYPLLLARTVEATAGQTAKHGSKHNPVGTYPLSFHPRFPITQTLPPSLPTPPRPLFPLSPVMMKLLLEKTKGKPSTSSSFSHRFSRGWKEKKEEEAKNRPEKKKNRKKNPSTVLATQMCTLFYLPPFFLPLFLLSNDRKQKSVVDKDKTQKNKKLS